MSLQMINLMEHSASVGTDGKQTRYLATCHDNTEIKEQILRLVFCFFVLKKKILLHSSPPNSCDKKFNNIVFVCLLIYLLVVLLHTAEITKC